MIDKTCIFIFGDSHTSALSKASKNMENINQNIEFDINWILSEKPNRVVRGNLRLNDALEKVTSLKNNDVVIISLLGTTHNIVGLLQHEEPYSIFNDNKFSELISLNGQLHLIPSNVMFDFFYEHQKRNKSILKIKEKSAIKVFHLMTPPPKKDQDFLQNRIKRYRGRIAKEVGITPPNIRRNLWYLEMQALSLFCSDHNISLIPPPEETISSDGFLKKKYYANDATHANADYGELVLQQLVRIVNGENQ